MAAERVRPPNRVQRFLATYTKGLTSEDLQRLFTRDTVDAYRFFARGIDPAQIASLPWHRRLVAHVRLFFLAFTLRMPPARRVVFGLALLAALIGFVQLFRGFDRVLSIPVDLGFGRVSFGLLMPQWADGTLWLALGFVLANLLVLLEVADRLSLKNDLDIAREIQLAMLPHGLHATPGVEAFGMTRPANTVGGDFYDILARPDGRLVIALGDVAGKGSPAALLMALLLAIFRTLVDEGLEGAALAERLNVQVARHSPPSRFITLFLAAYDPGSGWLTYVNAGQTPPLVYRRATGRFDRLLDGGIALGMFEASRYEAARTCLEPGDLLVSYSDGITEAEDREGRPFEEAGLEQVVRTHADADARSLADAAFRAVELHTRDARLADDLTMLVLRRIGGSTIG